MKDAEGYLDAIGQEQTANIKSKADIERAEADRDAYVKEKEAEKIAEVARNRVETSIADYEKEYKTKQASHFSNIIDVIDIFRLNLTPWLTRLKQNQLLPMNCKLLNSNSKLSRKSLTSI